MPALGPAGAHCWARCRRFQALEPGEIDQLELEPTREAIMSQLHPSNLEVNVVGDFDPAQVGRCGWCQLPAGGLACRQPRSCL